VTIVFLYENKTKYLKIYFTLRFYFTILRMPVHAGLAVGWILFGVISALTLVFSFLYIRYYQHKYDKELSSTVTSILALSICLVTSALGPVDIFLVSYMKYSNGTFKEWANITEERKSIEDTVLYAYYALYICVMVFVFLFLPLVYFFYEEKDDDVQVSTKQRCCTAMKYTAGFLFMATILLVVGAFAPVKIPPNTNQTEWRKIEYMFKEFASNNGEDALSFVISCLTLIGLLLLIIYTAYGMSAWPIDLLKGTQSASSERMRVIDERTTNRTKIEAIRNKYSNGRPMRQRDRIKIAELEETDRLMSRQEAQLESRELSCLSKCSILLRPVEILAGIVFFLIALVVFVSLLLTNIDKVMHSLGWRMGYALPKRTLPNPVDIMLVYAQMIFPLDYIIMSGIILYFFFCSVMGIRKIGIWFCWLRMFKIRPRKTRPQGLLFMCMMLMFMVLAINILTYMVMPQYTTYGGQHYLQPENRTAIDPATNHTYIKIVLTTQPCNTHANTQLNTDVCIMTRMSFLLTRFFYKVWFFGAAYFFASWGFLGMCLIGFIVALIRRRKSAIDGEVDEDDFDSVDDELIRA
ncbi:unnamed protein product, partial [Owenia fusiformis]